MPIDSTLNPRAAAEDSELLNELREARLEIRMLRAELARTAPDISDLRNQITAARHQGERYRLQVAELRRSSSWRITKPLRLLRRQETNATP
jgi:septal ring factor EnvC (AmiA/AmiB activator)